jgi:hypothetical protein
MLYRETIGLFSDPHKTHKYPVSVIKTSQLMLYGEIITVCSQTHTKHINTQSVPHSKHTPSQLYKPVS